MFLDKLIDDNLWDEYLQDKLTRGFISKKEKDEIKDFVQNKKYKQICFDLYNHNYKFSIPKKHLINKNYGAKKRVVYTYSKDEMNILKFIAYLLYEYDYLFSKNLYSFRKVIGVKDAVKSITYTRNIKNMYGYKVDISNYFNSINKELLLTNLKHDIKDSDLYNIFLDIIGNKYVIYEDKQITEEKGVVAGNPISSFLANYYLRDLDHFFWDEKVFYIRYADDIIIFTKENEEREKYKNILYSYLNKYKLKINKNKERYYEPGEKFEFLGFNFDGNKVDLSNNTIHKIKGKIKRSSRGIRRWMLRKNVNYLIAIKAMNRKYNKKFYGNDNSELSWKYWYFPTINTSSSLKLIDNYYQMQVRFIATGHHNKKNYKIVPYKLLKECNYKPLVNEYYKSMLNMKN